MIETYLRLVLNDIPTTYGSLLIHKDVAKASIHALHWTERLCHHVQYSAQNPGRCLCSLVLVGAERAHRHKKSCLL